MAQVSINLNAKDNVSQVISKLEEKIKKLRKNSENIKITATGQSKGGGGGVGAAGLNLFENLVGANLATQAINKLTSSIVALGKASFDQARLMESVQKRINLAAGGSFGGRALTEKTLGFAGQYGLSKEATVESFSKFAVSANEAGLTSTESQGVFENTSKAIAAMGLSAEDTKGVFLAFSQMLGKGKVSSEELRQQLAERIPGAMALAAKSMNMTMPDFIEKLEKGEIQSKKFVIALTNLFGEKYGDAASQNLTTLEGKLNDLDNSFFDLKNAIADSLGPATLRMIENLSAGVQDFTSKISSFFGQSTAQQNKGMLTDYSKQLEEDMAAARKRGDTQYIKKQSKDFQQMYDDALGQLSQKIQQNPELLSLLDPSTASKLQKSFENESNFRKTYGASAETLPGIGNIRAKRKTDLENAFKQLEAQPLDTGSSDNVFNPFGENFGGFTRAAAKKFSGATKNTELFQQSGISPLLQNIEIMGTGLNSANKGLEDLGKEAKSAKESLVGKEPKDKKIKSDFHTPRIVNINILNGEGASLINGGIQNDFNSQSVDVNSFRNQIQSVVEQTMMDVVTNAGTSLARLTTNKYN